MASKIVKYTKKQLKEAESLNYSKDLLEVLLEDGKEYSVSEIDKLVDAFNNREVML